MRYDTQNKILTQVRDCFGDLWHVIESRPTEFGWNVLLGYPAIGQLSTLPQGGAAIIPTVPLRDYLEENRMTPGMVRLPIGKGAILTVRKKLGMHYAQDKEQWWKQVKQELLHPEEPPIPALLDTDRLTPLFTWPKAMLRRLLKLVKEGKTLPEIAGIMGQNEKLVGSFCRRLLGARKEWNPWSAEEKDKLVQLKKEGKSSHEIAAILGRKPASVTYKAWGLVPTEGRHGHTWTKKEKQQLIKLTKEKKAVEEIMKIMERSRTSVIFMQRNIAREYMNPRFSEAKRGCRAWTKEEDQKLLELALIGHSPAELAGLMGRTRVAIWTRCHKLLGPNFDKKLACYCPQDSVSSPEQVSAAVGTGTGELSLQAERNNQFWAEEEDQKLRELAMAGFSLTELAEFLGRTREATARRCGDLGLKYCRKRRCYYLPDSASSPEEGAAGTIPGKLLRKAALGKYPWTEKEDQRLVELALVGHSHVELARFMGRTLNAIKIRCHKLGLKYDKKRKCYGPPDSAPRSKPKKIAGTGPGKPSPQTEQGGYPWTEKETQRLEELALAGHSQAELAGLMGRTPGVIKIRCRKLGLKYDKKLARYRLRDSASSLEQGNAAGTGSGKFSPGTERGLRHWTEEEDQKLLELILAGHSPAELTGFMGRTLRAIKIRCRKLGLKYDKKLARYRLRDSA